MGPQRCLRGRGWQRSPRFSCGTTSANLPPFLVLHRLDPRRTTQRAMHAVRRTIAAARIATSICSLTADCARVRKRGVRLHHPAMAIDQNLDAPFGVNPLVDVFDESLSIIQIAGGQEDAATRKRYVCNATSQFHLHLVDPLSASPGPCERRDRSEVEAANCEVVLRQSVPGRRGIESLQPGTQCQDQPGSAMIT